MTRNLFEWVPYSVKEFQGLNLTAQTQPTVQSDQGNLQDGEFTELVNMDVYPDYLRKRAGIALKGSPAFGTDRLKAIGYLYRLDSDVANLVFNRGAGFNQGKLYHSTNGGAILTEVLSGGVSMDSTMPKMVEYNNYLYGGTYDDGVFEYDGSTMTHMTGSPNGYSGAIVQDRLFLIVGNTNTIRFSEPGSFSGAGQWPAINVFTIGGPSSDAHDPIVSLESYQDRLVIFRQYSIYVLYLTGTPANWQLKQFIGGIGATSIYSTVQAENFIYFVGHKGVYRTNLSTTEELSTKIYNKFKNRVSIGQGPTLADTLVWSGDAIGFWNNKIIVSLDTSPFTQELLVYNTVSDLWTTYQPANTTIAKPWSFVLVRNSYIQSSGGDKIPVGLYWAGTDSLTNVPRICHFSDVNFQQDDGNVYTCRLRTKVFNLDNPFNLKKIPRTYLSGIFSSTIQLQVICNYDKGALTLVNALTGFSDSSELIKMKGPDYTCQFDLEFILSSSGDALIRSFGFDVRQEMRPDISAQINSSVNV